MPVFAWCIMGLMNIRFLKQWELKKSGLGRGDGQVGNKRWPVIS
jgi:hypothetical protein